MVVGLTLAMVGVAWVALRGRRTRGLAAQQVTPPTRARGRR